MIGKIDPKTIIAQKSISPRVPLITGEGPDFQSVLNEKLDVSKPLETMVIEFLSQTIEAFLSKPSSEDEQLFLSPSLSLGLPIPPSQTEPHGQTPGSPVQGLSGATSRPHDGAFPLPAEAGRAAAGMKGQPSQTNNLSSIVADQPPAEVSSNLQEDQDFDHFADKVYRNDELNFEQIVDEASRMHGVDPGLIRAVIEVESAGNAQAVSKAGALGLMQLMPGTAAELGVTNPFDPVQNIMAGTRYLRQLMDRYRGNVRLALAAYNWGMGNLEKRPDGLPKETRNYIVKVENLYHPQMAASL